jgi:hypothetical protein
LEHIPPRILVQILKEGKRILNKDGLLIHRINFSDHFSHSDNTITSVNFLQFSEAEWIKWAGNRYMYHNRLRIDEFLCLLKEADLKPVRVEPDVDAAAEELLKQGRLPLDKRFQSKPAEVNATLGAWVTAMSPAEI